MALHLEFVVQGPPISNQQRKQKGKAILNAWRAVVLAEVQSKWANPKLNTPLQATIINFHTGSTPSVDVDNMSKPIFDEMQKDVYDDDRQIRQAHIAHLEIGPQISISGASSLQGGSQFVYIRVEDPVSPYPLPT
jgi:Holliday junction resolvase RusA-like endonuclease